MSLQIMRYFLGEINLTHRLCNYTQAYSSSNIQRHSSPHNFCTPEIKNLPWNRRYKGLYFLHLCLEDRQDSTEIQYSKVEWVVWSFILMEIVYLWWNQFIIEFVTKEVSVSWLLSCMLRNNDRVNQCFLQIEESLVSWKFSYLICCPCFLCWLVFSEM